MVLLLMLRVAGGVDVVIIVCVGVDVVVVVEGDCYYIDIIVEHLDLYTFRRRRFYLCKTTLFDLDIGKMLLWSR